MPLNHKKRTMKNKKREKARLNKTEKTSSFKGCPIGNKSDDVKLPDRFLTAA